MRYILSLFLLFFIVGATAQHNIIPEPVEYIAQKGSFEMGNQIDLILNSPLKELENVVAQLSKSLKKRGVNSTVNVSRSGMGNGIRIALSKTPIEKLGTEGYTLVVQHDGIEIQANTKVGIHNAVQTLIQLIPNRTGKGNPISISHCSIQDYPRFKWRGLMLDVSRHFFTVEEVKDYLDAMATYKMNTFHWHLTDDNGWRIEIKSYPKLTEVGAWRPERLDRFGGRKNPDPLEPKSYGGFYTQEQIRDVVQYAQNLNITILPEIDVPGHSMALLSAYPEFSTLKEKKYVNPGTAFSEWYGNGTFKMLTENTLNPSDEKVYEFLDKVFGEVAQLFPGTYIHVGGDECDHRFWEADAECQALMKKEGLKNGHDLQSYFMRRMEKIISKHGKKMMGWDEILDGGLAEGAAVMSWRGMKGGIEAAKMGHDVVMSPTTFAYLDYTQGDQSVENRIYASLSLKKCYSFEPVPDGVDAKYILGGQGNVWTEQMPTMDHVFYMTYPRAMAIAETMWSPKGKKNWDGFTKKLDHHFKLFELNDRSVSKAIYDPIIDVTKEGKELLVQVSSDLKEADLYYTLDFTFPNHRTRKVSGPIEIPEGEVEFKVVTYREGKPLGRTLSLTREELENRVK